jgi:hypothetical protein
MAQFHKQGGYWSCMPPLILGEVMVKAHRGSDGSRILQACADAARTPRVGGLQNAAPTAGRGTAALADAPLTLRSDAQQVRDRVG